MADRLTYRAEPDPEFADRLERVLLRRLTATSDGLAQSDDPARTDTDPNHRGDIIMLDIADRRTGPVTPRRRSPNTWLMVAAAAAVVALVGTLLVAAGDNDEQPVDTATQPTDGPTTLAQGKVRFVEPPTPAGCCVPPGGGLSYPAGQGLGGQSLSIAAEEEDGEVTGEARFTLRNIMDSDLEGFPTVVELECVDTQTDDVILGGTVTTRIGDLNPAVGTLIAMIIREGEPDSATVWWDDNAATCQELLDSVPQPRPDDAFVEVVSGDNIETGG